MTSKQRQAVVLVHFQADFTELHNGALPVPGTDATYVDLVVKSTAEFHEKGIPIVATRDWHPADHISFASNHPGRNPFEVIRIEDREQVLWPAHCVQETPGARILIPAEMITVVVSSGYEREFESYSGFRSDGGTDTGLKRVLDDLGAQELIIYGLATDYCVRATVLHALEAGYSVILEERLCRGITEQGVRSAIEEMAQAGARIVTDRSTS